MRRIVFKKIEGTYYEISNEGHIRSNKGKRKILKWYYKKTWPYVELSINGKPKEFSVNELLKKHFKEELLIQNITVDEYLRAKEIIKLYRKRDKTLPIKTQ